MTDRLRVLNLYAGIGGNRHLWSKSFDVTAVELNEEVAEHYQMTYPGDKVVVDNAHQYLLHNHQDYDFVWSSPPCQSHSRMIRSGRNRKPRYPDFRIYEEIHLLQNDFTGAGWVVENVVPYYKPLISPTTKIGRHLFWCSDPVDFVADVPSPVGFISKQNQEAKKALVDWLGIPTPPNIYMDTHDPTQILRNCVHPLIGRDVVNSVLQGKIYQPGENA